MSNKRRKRTCKNNRITIKHSASTVKIAASHAPHSGKYFDARRYCGQRAKLNKRTTLTTDKHYEKQMRRGNADRLTYHNAHYWEKYGAPKRRICKKETDPFQRIHRGMIWKWRIPAHFFPSWPKKGCGFSFSFRSCPRLIFRGSKRQRWRTPASWCSPSI